MKKVLLTGASGGIGKAIKKELEAHSYKIYSLGRKDDDINCDLLDLASLENKTKAWLKNNSLDVLINCAGFGKFAPHETISSKDIQNLITLNLTVPILLSNLCLRSLVNSQGHIINITSIEATRHSKFSALYTATKSGLRNFSLSLFEEVRNNGVKISSINPDITKTSFFDDLNFMPSCEEDSFLLPSQIAKTVLGILNTNGVISDITIRPLKNKISKKINSKK